jgi:AcrR family transcriptional regulator
VKADPVPAQAPESAPPGPSARSRRRGPRKGDIREQAILEHAARLLAEKSIHQIGVDELAQGADLSRPTFYFYFESKFAVLQALVDRVVRETYDAASSSLASEEAPEVAIRNSIEAVAEQWRERGAIMRAAVETWGTVPEMGRYWEAITAGFVEAAAARIRRERRTGVAPEGAPGPKALATALIWMNERCFYTAAAGATPSLSESEIVDTLTAIWLRSLYGSEHPSRVAGAGDGGEERAAAQAA